MEYFHTRMHTQYAPWKFPKSRIRGSAFMQQLEFAHSSVSHSYLLSGPTLLRLTTFKSNWRPLMYQIIQPNQILLCFIWSRYNHSFRLGQSGALCLDLGSAHSHLRNVLLFKRMLARYKTCSPLWKFTHTISSQFGTSSLSQRCRRTPGKQNKTLRLECHDRTV